MAQIFGLILDIFGALLLFAGTERLNKAMLSLLDYLQISVGTIGMDIAKFEFSDNIIKQKKIANKLTRFGLLMLVIGFVLQLISALN